MRTLLAVCATSLQRTQSKNIVRCYRNYDEAIRVMQRATAVPKNTKISYHDQVKSRQVIRINGYVCSLSLGLQSLSAQARLFKSLKLWSYYVDLEESIGTVETTKAVYDRILELRIANAQVCTCCATFSICPF